MPQVLKQAEWDGLSAYLDGELPAEQAEQVRRRVEADPAWGDALARLRAVDQALDAWPAPAAAPELAGRIIRAARREPAGRLLTWRRVLTGAVAAAAAVALAVGLGRRYVQPAPTPDRVAARADDSKATGADTPEMTREQLDEFAVENLGFFEDYDVLNDYETLEAIERLDRSRSSGT